MLKKRMIILCFLAFGSLFLKSENIACPATMSSDSVTFKEIELNACFSEESRRLDINVIQVTSQIDTISFSAYIDTDLYILDECLNSIPDNYKPNTIDINSATLPIPEELHAISTTQLIPTKLLWASKDVEKYLILELYNFSNSTVGGGFLYIIIHLNELAEGYKYDTWESTSKQPFSQSELIHKLFH